MLSRALLFERSCRDFSGSERTLSTLTPMMMKTMPKTTTTTLSISSSALNLDGQLTCRSISAFPRRVLSGQRDYSSISLTLFSNDFFRRHYFRDTLSGSLLSSSPFLSSFITSRNLSVSSATRGRHWFDTLKDDDNLDKRFDDPLYSKGQTNPKPYEMELEMKGEWEVLWVLVIKNFRGQGIGTNSTGSACARVSTKSFRFVFPKANIMVLGAWN